MGDRSSITVPTYLTSARRQTSGIGTTQFIGMALKVNVHLGESRKLNQLKKNSLCTD